MISLKSSRETELHEYGGWLVDSEVQDSRGKPMNAAKIFSIQFRFCAQKEMRSFPVEEEEAHSVLQIFYFSWKGQFVVLSKKVLIST